MKLLIVMLLMTTLLISGCTQLNPECKADPKQCTVDSECMCSTTPCFLGNKDYFNSCADKAALGSCLDACGFGPYDVDFEYICEDSQCIIATFNRTTGQRLAP